MTSQTDRDRLLAFLDTLPNGGLTPGQDALEFDSLALVQVIAYLETEYDIRLNELNLEPDDLRSVDKILALISR